MGDEVKGDGRVVVTPRIQSNESRPSIPALEVWPRAFGRQLVWVALLAVVLPVSVIGGRFLRQSQAPDSELASHESPASEVALSPSPNGMPWSRGEMLYEQYCARCHGSDGQGGGEGLDAGPLAIRPRDFADSQWRFPKTRESIERVVREGIPGTLMPAAGPALTDIEIRAVAEHVLALSERRRAFARRTPSVLELGFMSQDDASIRLAENAELVAVLRAAGFRPITASPAPDARFVRTSDGVHLRLSSLRGKTVLLHFWGTTCAHCLVEFPKVVNLAGKFGTAGLEVVSVCADEVDAPAIEASARRQAGDHPLFADETGLAMHKFQVQLLPTFVLIDPQGQMVAVRSGALEVISGEKVISEDELISDEGTPDGT